MSLSLHPTDTLYRFQQHQESGPVGGERELSVGRVFLSLGVKLPRTLSRITYRLHVDLDTELGYRLVR